MSSFRRPSATEIEARLRAGDEPFSYPEVGATRDFGATLPASLAPTYDLDHHHFPLGTGRALFDRAREALATWRHFKDVPWLEFHGGESPATQGQVVASLVSLSGFWLLNPCRVVYTELPEGPCDMAGFAYGTLKGHVECGEERFVVSFDPASEEVHYEIAAFSRPAVLLAKLGYPFARRVQRRFAVASAKALARASA